MLTSLSPRFDSSFHIPAQRRAYYEHVFNMTALEIVIETLIRDECLLIDDRMGFLRNFLTSDRRYLATLGLPSSLVVTARRGIAQLCLGKNVPFSLETECMEVLFFLLKESHDFPDFQEA